MQRVEYKVREVNRKWLDQVLQNAGAKVVFEGETFTTYYNSRSGKFARSGKRLSLRSKGERHLLTYLDKHREFGIGMSDEYEVEVSDPYVLDKILNEIGFRDLITFKKYRVDYKADNVTISFDKYLDDFDYIPEFMMIESTTEHAVFQWGEILGYTRKDLEAITVLELIRQYKNRRKEEKSP